MKAALTINWLLTMVFSISTGVFKLIQQEADMQLFEKIGFSAFATTALGAVQVAGGIMLMFQRTRIPGAWLMLLTFILASIAVFANGLFAFGGASLIFIVMAGLVIYMEKAQSGLN